MRCFVAAMWLLVVPLTSAVAQVSIGIRIPSVSIGIEMPGYPSMVQVPGYPVYYAPGGSSNYFFYDGLYWVYQRDNWYSSTWYDGPWVLEAPDLVPAFILRVPVRYFRRPPAYFTGWRHDEPPRWGEHWGSDWQRRHGGWERWDRGAAPPPAPLPAYQKAYAGGRYPREDQQDALHRRSYPYRPRDPVVQQVYRAQRPHDGPAPARPGNGDQRARTPQQRDVRRTTSQASPEPAVLRGSPPATSRNGAGHEAQGAKSRGRPARTEGNGRTEGDDRKAERNR